MKATRALLSNVLAPRDRQYLTILLPIGIVMAVFVDAIFLAAIGGWSHPVLGPPGPCACPASYDPGVQLGAPNESALPDAVVFPVTVAEPGLWIGNISLEFADSSGLPVTTGLAGSLLSGTVPLATFNFTSGVWTTGSGVTVFAGEAIALSAPNLFTFLGGTLTVSEGPASTLYQVPY